MGRGSVFLKDNDVVIDARKLKELERKAASGAAVAVDVIADVAGLQAKLVDFRQANEGLSRQNDALRAQLGQGLSEPPTSDSVVIR